MTRNSKRYCMRMSSDKRRREAISASLVLGGICANCSLILGSQAEETRATDLIGVTVFIGRHMSMYMAEAA